MDSYESSKTETETTLAMTEQQQIDYAIRMSSVEAVSQVWFI